MDSDNLVIDELLQIIDKSFTDNKVKVTQDEKNIRLRVVELLIAKGKSRFNICRLMSKKWDLSYRQVDRYIAEAKDGWHDDAAKDRAKNFNTTIRIRENLRDKLIEDEDFKGANVVQDSIDKLCGLFIEYHEHSGGISVLGEDAINAIYEAGRKIKKVKE